MIYKKSAFGMLMSIILTLNLYSIAFSQPIKEVPSKILILYDTAYQERMNVKEALEGILHHYNVEITSMNEEQFTKNLFKKFDAVVILDQQNHMGHNVSLIKDLAAYTGQIFWIGNHPQNLMKSMGIQFRNTDVKKGLMGLMHDRDDYKRVYPYSNPYAIIPELEIENPDHKVFIKGKVGYNSSLPIIGEVKNLTYCLLIDAYSTGLFALADTFFEYFTPLQPIKKQISVRIEDVHPFRDQKKLRHLADVLYQEKIPFMIVLIPAYKNTKTGELSTLSHIDGFSKTIKYMQKKGGRVVLHGYKHSYKKYAVTGEGFEFWNGDEHKPLDVDMKEYVEKLVTKGIEECLMNGIYPFAFEAPHYAVSQEGYKQLHQYFSTLVGHIQVSDYDQGTVGYPYRVRNTKRASLVIPENIGYIDINTHTPLKNLYDKFKKLEMIRSFDAGYFVHPYIDIKYLKETIKFFKNKGIKFYDPLEDDHKITLKDTVIEWKNAHVKVDTQDPVLIKNSYEKIAEAIFKWITRVLFLVALLFLYINRKLRKQRVKQVLGENNE